MKTPRTFHLLIAALTVVACLIPIAASAQMDSTTVRHVADRIPVVGFSREQSADRPEAADSHPKTSRLSPKANPWKLQATLSGTVIHDICFPTTLVGYAAAELGQVWKTTDGGSKWTEIMNLGFPYYWFGVKALTAKDVVISGFNDSTEGGPDSLESRRRHELDVRYCSDHDRLVVPRPFCQSQRWVGAGWSGYKECECRALYDEWGRARVGLDVGGS